MNYVYTVLTLVFVVGLPLLLIYLVWTNIKDDRMFIIKYESLKRKAEDPTATCESLRMVENDLYNLICDYPMKDHKQKVKELFKYIDGRRAGCK